MSSHTIFEPLSITASPGQKRAHYEAVAEQIKLLVEGESNLIAVLATVACELHRAFDYFNWTGFYQVDLTLRDHLVIGPYQGSHGCLRIPVGRGVCGTAAFRQETQLVPDVDKFPGHIACASTTRSEVVVPYHSANGDLLGVLDIDSNTEAAFDKIDQQELESLCKQFASWNSFHNYLGKVKA